MGDATAQREAQHDVHDQAITGSEDVEGASHGVGTRFTSQGAIPPVGATARGGPAQASASEVGYDGAHAGNEFHYEMGGKAPVAAGGKLEQLKQAAYTADLSISAGLSVASGNRLPSDRTTRAQLRALHTNAPLPGFPLSTTDYTSHIADVPPQQVYAWFVAHPDKVFGSAGIGVRGFSGPLTDGARLMLQESGPPPVWAPIEVKLDAKNFAVHITTMDGHPLRGANHFQFVSDGKNGTTVQQHSEFQGSSPLVEIGKRMGAIDRQHQIWQSVHAELAGHSKER